MTPLKTAQEKERWEEMIILLSKKSDKTRSGLETTYDPYALIDQIKEINKEKITDLLDSIEKGKRIKLDYVLKQTGKYDDLFISGYRDSNEDFLAVIKEHRP